LDIIDAEELALLDDSGLCSLGLLWLRLERLLHALVRVLGLLQRNLMGRVSLVLELLFVASVQFFDKFEHLDLCQLLGGILLLVLFFLDGVELGIKVLGVLLAAAAEEEAEAGPVTSCL